MYPHDSVPSDFTGLEQGSRPSLKGLILGPHFTKPQPVIPSFQALDEKRAEEKKRRINRK